MKTLFSQVRTVRGIRAMTLAEMMTSMGIFTLAVAALLSVNFFGLRQDELVCSKLGASDQARLNFDLMVNEIRAGKNVQIGYGTSTNFTPATNGYQIGDTLQIIPSTNTNVFIYYYFYTNPPNNGSWLMRVSANNGTNVTNTVAKNLTNWVSSWMQTNALVTNSMASTNAMAFQAMNFNGTNWVVLTNDPTVYSTHNYCVSVLLQFWQYQYPLTRVGGGSNYLYDYYQMELSAARRAE